MNLFRLVREEDPTGISGTGEIAEGVEFSDGSCVLRWTTEHVSTSVYSSIEELEAIHGHEGATRVVWVPPPVGSELNDRMMSDLAVRVTRLEMQLQGPGTAPDPVEDPDG